MLFKLKNIKILLFIVFALSACVKDDLNIITKNNYDTLNLNDFVEPNFPFIHTSLDLRNIGENFPAYNFASRIIATQLGNNAYMAFDPDMIRWAAAWTGDFISMKGVAQVSYKDYFSKNDGFPQILGKSVLATGIYPGWTNYFPDFKDPREYINPADSLTWGTLPDNIGRWKGTYTKNEKTIIHYAVDQTDIYDFPFSKNIDGETLFGRNIKINAFNEKLYSVLAEIKEIKEVKKNDNELIIELNNETIIIGVKSKNQNDHQIKVVDNQYVVLELRPQSEKSIRTIYFWSGKEKSRADISEFIQQIKPDFPDLKKQGDPYWTDKVYTQGHLAEDTAAYVMDVLTLPVPNPWKRNVRAADIDFFKNGNAAVLTFDGDIWLLKNIKSKLKKLEWSRFASGFFEAMTLKIVDDEIFVFGREGVIKVHDFNKDGSADYYENYVHDIVQSIDSREWAADMAFDNEGNIFLAKGGGTIPKDFPSISSKPTEPFRASTNHAGTILKINPSGEKTQIYATGLRLPYIGLNPKDGFLTASDQQGNFVPASPIYRVKENQYFGVSPANHFPEEPEIQNPITWIPHRIDQSSISQFWMNTTKLGPLNNSMIHVSFGRPGLFTVLQDKNSTVDQGGVVYIKADYPAPLLKGDINPKDGLFYVAGFNLWGSNSNGISTLMRLRYTGKPYLLPKAFQAGKQGIILTFDEKLDKNSVSQLNNFKVKRWNYLRTAKYGSGHYLLNGEPGEENLPVLGSHLSKDGKSVLLLIPNMTEVMQMELTYSLKTGRGREINDEFYFTVNDASVMKIPKTLSHVKIDLDKLILTPEELLDLQQASGQISIELGKSLFQKYACEGCHALDPTVEGKYGPSLVGLFKSEQEFIDGSKLLADEDYIRESILDSKARIVKGYRDEMPSYTGVLKDFEVESLVEYIKTL